MRRSGKSISGPHTSCARVATRQKSAPRFGGRFGVRLIYWVIRMKDSLVSVTVMVAPVPACENVRVRVTV